MLSVRKIYTSIYVTILLLTSCTITYTIDNAHKLPCITPAIQYAPWRDTYLNQIHKKSVSEQCVFCRIHTLDDNNDNYILYKGTYHYVILNAHPYMNAGYHLLIIPYAHEKHYTDLSEESRKELDDITQKICESLSDQAHEIHINCNIGINALASIPNHLHQHIMINNTQRVYNLIDALHNTTRPVDNATQWTTLLPLFTQSSKICTHAMHAAYDDTCYYCGIIQQAINLKNTLNQNALDEFCKKNLIIHCGTHATILFNHHPFCPGDTIIVPHAHYTNRADMPYEVLAEIRTLLTTVYPHLLSLFNAEDLNMGMVSYGDQTLEKHHIRYQIVPRKWIPAISPITHTHYIHTDIMQKYVQLRGALNIQ